MKAFTYALAGAGAAITFVATRALAHEGHPTQAGVPESGHAHLWSGAVVGPEWLAVLALAMALAVFAGLRARRASRRRALAPVDAGRGARRAPR